MGESAPSDKKPQAVSGRIFLIPTPLAENTHKAVLSPGVIEACSRLDFYLAENERTARRFLGSLKLGLTIERIEITPIPDGDPSQSLGRTFSQVEAGRDLGILSEAGCPGIADPGAGIVAAAHRLGLKVIPLAGPSSIVLALMASGLNGQHFEFRGYLPIKKEPRYQAIINLERQAVKSGSTQIFIETPYRNDSLLSSLVSACQPQTLLCIATDLTADDMEIRTQPIHAWKKNPPALNKRPSIFLIGRSNY